nr:hypothetical protein [Candidatus Woesearchaeota archaeon]
MASDLKKEFEKIRSSKEFKKLNKNSYLSSCFLMDDKDAFWQINFYNPNEDNIMIFICKEKIEVKGPEKVLKERGSKVEKLDLTKVKINFDKAIKKIVEFKFKKYKNINIDKTFIILQTIDKKPLWNISYLTQGKILNIRLDAVSGKILGHRLEQIIKF